MRPDGRAHQDVRGARSRPAFIVWDVARVGRVQDVDQRQPHVEVRARHLGDRVTEQTDGVGRLEVLERALLDVGLLDPVDRLVGVGDADVDSLDRGADRLENAGLVRVDPGRRRP